MSSIEEGPLRRFLRERQPLLKREVLVPPSRKVRLNIGYIHETMPMIGRNDVENAQEIVERFKGDPWIIAKIENGVLVVEARYPLVSFHWDEEELRSVYRLEHSTERRR